MYTVELVMYKPFISNCSKGENENIKDARILTLLDFPVLTHLANFPHGVLGWPPPGVFPPFG